MVLGALNSLACMCHCQIRNKQQESEDGKFMIGSMFIVESTREAAERFISEDPFSSIGVWKQVQYLKMLFRY